jgi:hypothetical protein
MHKTLVVAALALAFATCTSAKLAPAPDDAKEQAKETAAKNAWDSKVAAFKLCRSMDRVAETYRNERDEAHEPAPPAMTTPPCVDPGPYVSPNASSGGASAGSTAH